MIKDEHICMLWIWSFLCIDFCNMYTQGSNKYSGKPIGKETYNRLPNRIKWFTQISFLSKMLHNNRIR